MEITLAVHLHGLRTGAHAQQPEPA
jgi:hypothetical protein